MLKIFFTGTSPTGDLTQALENALTEAAKEFHEDSAWTIEKIGGKRLQLHAPISVTLRIGGDKGEDANPRIPK